MSFIHVIFKYFLKCEDCNLLKNNIIMTSEV